MTREISKFEDLIDSRDLIEAIEAAKDSIGDYTLNDDGAYVDVNGQDVTPEVESLEALLAFAKEFEDCAADYAYGETAIRDSYFKQYAMELADDIVAVPSDAAWPCTCIDWDMAARELKQDYTSIEFDGVTYWTR